MSVQFQQSYFLGVNPIQTLGKPSPSHRNRDETIEYLKQITGGTNEALQAQLRNAQEASNKVMMRSGRTPIKFEDFDKKEDLFNLDLMENGAITPRHVSVMAYIDPGMHRRTNMVDLYDQFSVEHWRNGAEELKNLSFLGEFFMVDSSIQTQLIAWDQGDVLDVSGAKPTLNLNQGQITATDDTKAAYKFLEHVLKLKKAATHVGGPGGPPTKPTRQQKIDTLKALAKETMGKYGVSESMGNAKIRAIKFEMEQIIATARTIPRDPVIDFEDKKDPFFNTTEGYLYQRLAQKLDQARQIFNGIQSNRDQELASIDKWSDQDLIEEKKITEFLKALKTNSQDEFEHVYAPIAEELVASMGSLGNVDTPESAEATFSEKYFGQSSSELIKNRAKDWDMDAAVMFTETTKKIPVKAHKIWGRYAGMSEAVITKIWEGSGSSVEAFVEGLKAHCKAKIKLVQQESQRSETANQVPWLKKSLDRLDDLKDILEMPNDQSNEPPPEPTESHFSNAFEERKDAQTRAKESLKKSPLLQWRKKRLARLERLSERYTFRYGMTEREMWAPLCELDGSKTVKQQLFVIPKETGDPTTLNAAAKAVLEACQQEPMDTNALTRCFNEFNSQVESLNLMKDPTLSVVEHAKAKYIQQVVKWHLKGSPSVPLTMTASTPFSMNDMHKSRVTTVQIKDPRDNPLAIMGDGIDGILTHLQALQKGFNPDTMDEGQLTQSVAIQWERAKALQGEVSTEQLDRLFGFRLALHREVPFTAHHIDWIKACCLKVREPRKCPNIIKAGVLTELNPMGIEKDLEGVINPDELRALAKRLYGHYQTYPSALHAHLRGEKLDANDLPADIKDDLTKMFFIDARWGWDQQQALIEYTMSWPPQLREWLAEVPGLFEGRRGLLMDTDTKDPSVVLHRYMERVAGVDGVDTHWSTLIHYAVQHKSSLEAISEGIEGRIHLEGFKGFIRAQINQVISSISVTESGDDIQVNGRIEELTQITESLADLEALGIDIQGILGKVLDTKLYRANEEGLKTIQRNIAATIMAKPGVSASNVIKAMIMMKQAHDGNRYRDQQLEQTFQQTPDQWRESIFRALGELKDSPADKNTLNSELMTLVFPEAQGTRLFDCLTEGQGIQHIAFNRVTQQLELTLELGPPNILLDPITMACTISQHEVATLQESTQEALKHLYFSEGIRFPTVVKATATVDGDRQAAALVGDHFAVINAAGKDEIYFQQAKNTWIRHVDIDEGLFPADVLGSSHIQQPLHQFFKAHQMSAWVNSAGQLFLYDQHMNCQYTIKTEHGQQPVITRLKDNAILTSCIMDHDRITTTWSKPNEGGSDVEVMEIENNGATLVLTKHGAHFEHENGFILQNSTQTPVFKHPTRREYMIMDCVCGHWFSRTTRDPNGNVKVVQPKVNRSHQLDAKQIHDHATPTDAMAQWLLFCRTEYQSFEGELFIQDLEELMANAVPATLSEFTMDQLNRQIEVLEESPKKTLAKMLLNNRLRHCTVETKDGHHQPGNNFKCDINGSDERQLQGQPLPVQLMAAWMAIDEGRSAETYFEAINALDTSSIPGKPHRMLMQLLAGQTGRYAKKLQQQFGVDATVLARANYNTVEALTRNPQNYLTVEAGHIPTQLAQLEARLHLLLADKGLGHLSAPDVLNIVIQGDRYGAFGDQKAAIQTLALNTLILTTRQLSDKKCTYEDRLIQVLNQSIEDPEEAFNAFRQCAVFLLCEMQLGGRLRPEQVSILTHIFNGQTRLAELRTGFGKTDVVLFLGALYMGQKQGVCIEMPDELLPSIRCIVLLSPMRFC